MNGNCVSLSGIVATSPESRLINGETTVTGFRLASTPRRYDPRARDWVNGRTTWVSVNCWRSLGRNVAVSLKVGQKIMVTGKLVSPEWVNADGQKRSRVEIEAESVGIDLTYGTVDFHKVNWSEPRRAPGQREVDELAESVERAAMDVDLSALLDPPEDDEDPYGADLEEEVEDLDRQAVGAVR